MTEMRSSGTLADLLAPRRRRRIVGRASKITFVQAAFDSAEPPCSRLPLRGLGDIGTTRLLDSFTGVAAATGVSETNDLSGARRPAGAVDLLGTLARR
jgi:hypothetical protein